MSEDFYRNIKALKNFQEITQEDKFTPVPEDWFLVITDVVNSTGAIEKGRYKDVNTAGALPSMALANLLGSMDFPFVFGGDGLTCLLPIEHREAVEDVLLDTGKMVSEIYSLQLRLGLVPMEDVYSAGHSLSLGKIKVSEHYLQAIFQGTGMAWAESMVKAKEKPNPYLVVEKPRLQHRADFSGFTCRWKDIPSVNGETVSVIVAPRGDNDQERSINLDEVLGLMEQYGRPQYHPLDVSQMGYHSNWNDSTPEAQLTAKNTKGIFVFLRNLWIRIEVFLLGLLGAIGISISVGHKKTSTFAEENRLSSDHRKFDGVLKMVLSLNHQERRDLEQALKVLHKAGKVYYGIHISDRALMTCMVHFSSEQEVHFVDAADGGYALAAKAMKQQMRNDPETKVSE